MELISEFSLETEVKKTYYLNFRDQCGNWYNKASDVPMEFTPDITGDRLDKSKLCPEYKGYKVASVSLVGKYVKTPLSSYFQEYEGMSDCVRNEIEAYEKLGTGHPNICKYHGCVVEDNLVTGIVLDKYKERLADIVSDNPQKVIEQLKDAVRYIHSMSVIHGDISPCNVMVRDGNIVLIDFDSCGEDNVKEGTVGFMNPEYAKTEACDWYSVGKVKEYILKRIREAGDEQNCGQAQHD
ncbi:hypothetical protein FBU59_002337 [Linderina macrospora]|uniref:Uncharacterized protein n=1 Tax=Linderina macrospora TaxID=4868 RepID=A0ACC1JBL2_9FUNG|nr:hypothetical protein FBU59_002337 [Linderina macrospora]